MKLQQSCNYRLAFSDKKQQKTRESEEIEKIISEGILNYKSFDDCLHITSAILSDCNIILSWNFKHMVNLNTINRIRRITFAKRYK